MLAMSAFMSCSNQYSKYEVHWPWEPMVWFGHKLMHMGADLGAAEHIERVFGKERVYGPVFRWHVRVYGSDIRQPPLPHLMIAIAKLLAVLQEDYAAALVLQAGYFSPRGANVDTSNHGKAPNS